MCVCVCVHVYNVCVWSGWNLLTYVLINKIQIRTVPTEPTVNILRMNEAQPSSLYSFQLSGPAFIIFIVSLRYFCDIFCGFY